MNFIFLNFASSKFINSKYSSFNLGDINYLNFDNSITFNSKNLFLKKFDYFFSVKKSIFLNLKISTNIKKSNFSSSLYKNSFNLESIFLEFPLITNKWSINLGIIPYSNIYHNFKLRIPFSGSLKSFIFNSKKGGISEIYFCNFWNLNNSISLIFKFSFFLGYITNENLYKINISNFFLKSSKLNAFNFKDFTFSFGIFYTKNISKFKTLNLLFNYQLKSDIYGNDFEFFKHDLYSNSNVLFDNIVYIRIPSHYVISFSYKNSNDFFLNLNFVFQNWNTFINYIGDKHFFNSYSVNLNNNYVYNFKKKNYVMIYNLGFKYSIFPFALKNKILQDIGFIAGLSIPIFNKDSVNIYLNFGKRKIKKYKICKNTFFNDDLYLKLVISISINNKLF